MPPESLVDAFSRVLTALREFKKHTSSNISIQQCDRVVGLSQRLAAAAAASPDALLHVGQLLQLQQVLVEPTCFQAALAAHAILAMLEPTYQEAGTVVPGTWSGAAVTSQVR